MKYTESRNVSGMWIGKLEFEEAEGALLSFQVFKKRPIL